MEPQPSRSVAEALADVWSWHRTPRFLDYVADSFGVRVADLAAFDALYIYQVADGDLERGQFDHGSTFQWWEVTDAGVRECGRPGQLLGWRDAPEKVRGSFYRWPYVSFLHCGERVGFGECFGPALLNRKAGQLAAGPGGIELAGVQVVWRG
ncbi:hypothetical protein GobsT_44360 [Gemmata obscuriglobus]|uniref:hypothetical protein n=1 Tax=Gemmata obscuriglobus TaxID=114 RepID=UPI00016C3BB9|nr:hypothetical protein [Gemmata obscuriglobus]QEG29636.1 hypothetical protein GobsT_44340 [Gemmata obscuriglobus]QEG29638.1 hypothetical protein GobsT_44360 [Gemmata obscuriglobus]VTS08953.1 unnamed protein product [Gemmata obscuriglobus UQM 2246]VTS08955.1 unnamed protein product [Gemmata obscuriglobus UQM 2246]